MSEYQYYEFVALDGPISDEGMKYAEGCSTRADVTPYRWRNEYNFGEFKGSPTKLLQHYDAHLYTANWGTFVFAIGVPSDLIDVHAIEPYLWDEDWDIGLFTTTKPGRMIVSWQYAEEGGDCRCYDDVDMLDELAAIREEIIRGDLRALFIGWLASFDPDNMRTDVPPIPAGLSGMTPAQRRLAERLDVASSDSLAAAETFSQPHRNCGCNTTDIIDALSPDELRNDLRRVLDGESMRVVAELNRKAVGKCEDNAVNVEYKTFLEKFIHINGERLHREAEASAARARQEEAKRKRKLTATYDRTDETWQELDTLMKTKKNLAYDDIAQTLHELATAHTFKERTEEFQTRLATFRSQWANRPAMMRRIETL
jgi:hypothetical protein